MIEKKKSFWNWINPLYWLEAAFQALAIVFGPILRLFGLMPPPSTEGFENLSRADVDDAKRLATEQEAAVDELQRQMTPAEVVRAYAKADAAGRAAMDLSALDLESQDWLLRLSDEDLTKLSMSTTNGCARSLERRSVLPIYAKPPADTETAEIYAIPTQEEIEQAKWDFISARYRELFHAPGIPNPNPKFVPTTLH
ncbi:hypothetical protein [Sinorhizobium fredii]|uniref:hypothetical protein n=1 Tax=Rhizobium fredii TaxID=380 RepID=UPI003515F243